MKTTMIEKLAAAFGNLEDCWTFIVAPKELWLKCGTVTCWKARRLHNGWALNDMLGQPWIVGATDEELIAYLREWFDRDK